MTIPAPPGSDARKTEGREIIRTDDGLVWKRKRAASILDSQMTRAIGIQIATLLVAIIVAGITLAIIA